jgi:ankyrin repeat protein
LFRAAEGGCSKVIRLLLEHGASASWRNKVGRTALHGASTSEVVRALCCAGADVSAKDNLGVSPLMEARRRRREDVVVALLEAGADAEELAGRDRGSWGSTRLRGGRIKAA